MKPKLSPVEAMNDMTSREAAKIISGLLGGLMPMMVNLEELRTAVRWLAETDEVWEALGKLLPVADAAVKSVLKDMISKKPNQ